MLRLLGGQLQLLAEREKKERRSDTLKVLQWFRTVGSLWYLCHHHSVILKGVVYDSKPIHFLLNSENISSRFACFLFGVRWTKSLVFIQQPWLCKRETNTVSQVEPPTQVVNYQRFSRVSTKHFGIVRHNSCSSTGQTNAVRYFCKFEGALKGGVYLFGCWAQISTSFLQNHRLHL